MSTQWVPRSFLHRISDGDKSWSRPFLITALLVHVCGANISSVCVCLDSNLVLTVNQILFRALQHSGRQKQNPQPAQHSEVPFTRGTENTLWILTASQPACQKRLHTRSRQALWTEDPTRRDVVLQSMQVGAWLLIVSMFPLEGRWRKTSLHPLPGYQGHSRYLNQTLNFYIHVYFTATAKKLLWILF